MRNNPKNLGYENYHNKRFDKCSRGKDCKIVVISQENHWLDFFNIKDISCWLDFFNIKDISCSMFVNHILIEKKTKPTSEMQKRLNQHIIDVVKVETLKLLDTRVIYLITSSKWIQSMWCLK